MPADRPIELNLPVSETKRPISSGAESWLGKVIPVSNDIGFVYLVDYMGNDSAIEQAARVSYGTGTRKTNQTEGLIRYLYRNRHTTPFEMVEFKFHAKMPIFVARQWVRHRTANINEYSARYSILSNEFYIPDVENISAQSKTNRQGRGESLVEDQAEEVIIKMANFFDNAYDLYAWLLNEDESGNPIDQTRQGLARELARIVLPTAGYTEWYWKIDLHNLLHFVSLRSDPHAQQEIRAYSDAMAMIVKDSVPIVWQAFEDYSQYASYLTAPEQAVFTRILENEEISVGPDMIREIANDLGITNKRELDELLEKFRKLGLSK